MLFGLVAEQISPIGAYPRKISYKYGKFPEGLHASDFLLLPHPASADSQEVWSDEAEEWKRR